MFLFSVQPPLKAVRSPFRADRRYDLLSYLFLFPAFSIFGWVLEAVINLINRGVIQSHTPLYGPWILLYGIYGILILFLLKRLIRKPVAVFLLNALLYSLLEYFINLGTELASGEGLRNYSEFLLNLDGKVYLGGTIAFALIGCAFLYYLAPRWADRYMKLGHSKRILLCTVLYILLIADIVFSVCISS